MRGLLRLCAIAAVAAPAFALAQGPAPTVAIVDFQQVVRESAALGTVRAQVETLRKSHEAEALESERRLRDLDQALARDREVLDETAFDAKRRDFEREFVAARNAVQARQQRMEQAYNAAMREIEKTIVTVTSDIARTQNINIVFGRNAIVIAETNYDITQQVLRQLNAELPSVTVQTAQN
ncbi:MAG: OmpH family outer membrane protein [Pseudomonadota bacterium]